MSGWKAKRFWSQATVETMAAGFTVHLDGRPVKTPAKAALIVPTRAMAAAIAAEWDAQTGEVDPRTMPVTRSANAAIDKVAHQHAEVAQMIADYGDSDLLCYRATGPAELIARQAEGWDPVLDWAAEALGVRLVPTQGVMHRPQDPAILACLSARVAGLNEFELAAFHDLVSLSGSLILGFAVEAGHLSVDVAWDLSRIDEAWQIEQWGADEEATAMTAAKRTAFVHAKSFLDLARPLV
jgi:chaperone required for assembly of F1-ATPase